jgi:hypothetical protein
MSPVRDRSEFRTTINGLKHTPNTMAEEDLPAFGENAEDASRFLCAIRSLCVARNRGYSGAPIHVARSRTVIGSRAAQRGVRAAYLTPAG